MKAPKHVAIIMDGNGRWAKERLRPRIWGHVRGASVVSQIVEEADNIGVEVLTLFTFSTENWSRPLIEIQTLFKLLKKYIQKERSRIIKNNIRFKVVGDTSLLADELKTMISKLESETKNNLGLKLNFAFNYGGRKEIVEAANKFILNNPGQLLCEESLRKQMCLEDEQKADVDLLIRTGGDFRISNFLLWHIAYSELCFTPTRWPEFKSEEFRRICHDYSIRERRFGSVEEEDSLEISTQKANSNRMHIQSNVQ